MGVYHPYQDLLYHCPVPIPSQHLLQAGGVLHLTRQGGEDLLEGVDGELVDTLLLSGVFLGGTNEVIHIDVYILEAVRRGCRAFGSLVRPICGGVDHEGGVGVQVVEVCVIGNRLGYGKEEVRSVYPTYGKHHINTEEDGGVFQEWGHEVIKLSNIRRAQVTPVEGVRYIPFGQPDEDIHRVGVPNFIVEDGQYMRQIAFTWGQCNFPWMRLPMGWRHTDPCWSFISSAACG